MGPCQPLFDAIIVENTNRKSTMHSIHMHHSPITQISSANWALRRRRSKEDKWITSEGSGSCKTLTKDISRKSARSAALAEGCCK